MLCRRYPPNEGLWNGLGGKIEANETPAECAKREVMEEAGMDVSGSLRKLRYAGLVTWNAGADPTSASRGMRTFVAEVEGRENVPERDMPEGLLARKPLEWVCDRSNDLVVGNIPRFLPARLESGGGLVGFAANPLPSRI